MTPARPAMTSNGPIHLVGAAVCLALVAAAAYTVVTPVVKARAESKAQLARLSSVSAELAQVAQVNRTLEAQLERTSASVEARMVTLVPAQDLNRRLAELTTLCLDRGLTPEVIQPREPVNGAVTPIQPIRFETSGPAEAVFGLLGLFENDHPDLHLDTLTLEHVGPQTVRLRTTLSWLTAPAR